MWVSHGKNKQIMSRRWMKTEEEYDFGTISAEEIRISVIMTAITDTKDRGLF